MALRGKCMRYEAEVLEYLRPYLANASVRKMKTYIQHGSVSTYDHCFNVACCSLYLARKWKWKVDEKSLVTGAFLHDFYLYDWHLHRRKGRLHGFCHTAAAAKNAQDAFGINDKIYYIIRTHMFPLTVMWMPRSKEGWLVCMADKYCAVKETKGRNSRASSEDGPPQIK